MQAQKHWYAIGIGERWTKKVAESFSRKKIEFYLPLNRLSSPSGAKNSTYFSRPLFDNICFVRLYESEISKVKQTEGVHHFFYWLGNYAIIDEEDIRILKVFLQLYQDVWVEKAQVLPECNSSAGSRIEFSGSGYKKPEKTEKILLPTLGYFLLARVEQEINHEILQHAI